MSDVSLGTHSGYSLVVDECVRNQTNPIGVILITYLKKKKKGKIPPMGQKKKLKRKV